MMSQPPTLRTRTNSSSYGRSAASRARRAARRRNALLARALLAVALVGLGFFLGRVSAPKPSESVTSPAPRPDVVDPPTPSDAPEPTPTPWNMVLVNWENPLPEDFEPPELTQLTNGLEVDSRMYPALQEMMDAARADGMDPIICSAYRSIEVQEELYANKVDEYLNQGMGQAEAEAKAATWVSRPGTSEHHTGLAVDIVSLSYQLLDEGQAETATQKWLMEHCTEYGFILRYPTEKRYETGINYEPWHYRYLGKEMAKAVTESGLCFEEYLAQNVG